MKQVEALPYPTGKAYMYHIQALDIRGDGKDIAILYAQLLGILRQSSLRKEGHFHTLPTGLNGFHFAYKRGVFLQLAIAFGMGGHEVQVQGLLFGAQ